VVLVNIMTLL